MISLRGRLLLTLSLALVSVWSLVTWLGYDKARHEVEELLDGKLALAARLLEGQARHEAAFHRTDGQPAAPAANTHVVTLDHETAARHPYEQVLAFHVWDRQGNTLLKSDNTPPMPAYPRLGFHDIELAGSSWRILVGDSQDGELHIQVAHPSDSREDIGLDVARIVAWPMLFGLPGLLLLVFWSVRTSLKPLGALAHDIRARNADRLEPFDAGRVVPEVQPLIEALNRLLAKVERSLQSERQLTANAAHELRTPLAALKIHAQLAAASPHEEDRRHAIERVLQGIRRAERLVDQMLRLARLDAGQDALRLETLDVLTLLSEVQEIEQPVAGTRRQRIVLDVAATVPSFAGDGELLLAALRNLVSNACRYGPAGDEILLGAHSGPQGIALFVRDHGPGVPAAELGELTRRFRRGRDVNVEGSGLGLAIVERIAALHGARLELRNAEDGGFLARLHFPAGAMPGPRP